MSVLLNVEYDIWRNNSFTDAMPALDSKHFRLMATRPWNLRKIFELQRYLVYSHGWDRECIFSLQRTFGSLVLLNMKWFLWSGSNKRRFFNSPIIWTWGEFRKVRLHEMRITVIFPSTCLSCMYGNGVYFGKLIFLNKTMMNMTYYTIDVIQTWLLLF